MIYQLKLLKESVKWNKRFRKALLYEFIYYIVFALIIFIFSLSTITIAQTAADALQVDASELKFEDMLNDTSVLSGFYYRFMAFFAVCAALYILARAYFKGKIYSILLDEKFTKKKFFKFLLLSIILLAITLLAVMKIQNENIKVFSVAVIFYLTITSSIALINTKSIKEFFRKFFSTAIKKLHYFIWPFVAACIVFRVLNIGLIELYEYNRYSVIFILLLFIVFIAWIKNYFIIVYKS